MGYSGFPRVDAEPMKPLIPLLFAAGCLCGASPGPRTRAPTSSRPISASPARPATTCSWPRSPCSATCRRSPPPSTCARRAPATTPSRRSRPPGGQRLRHAGRRARGRPALGGARARDLHPRRFLVRLHLQDGDVGARRAELGSCARRRQSGASLPAAAALVAEARDRAALEAVAAVVGTLPGGRQRRLRACLPGAARRRRAAGARPRRLARSSWSRTGPMPPCCYARARRGRRAARRGPRAGSRRGRRREQPELRLERAVMLMAAERNAEARACSRRSWPASPVMPMRCARLGYLEYFDGDHGGGAPDLHGLLTTGRVHRRRVVLPRRHRGAGRRDRGGRAAVRARQRRRAPGDRPGPAGAGDVPHGPPGAGHQPPRAVRAPQSRAPRSSSTRRAPSC
jgi:hypothetical protein